MRTIITRTLGAVALICTVGAADRDVTENDKLAGYLGGHRHEMTRVTQKPYRVWTPTPGSACAPAAVPFVRNPDAHNPHREHWIHVLVSPGGTNAMTTGKGTYPVDTVILKQKFLDVGGTNTEFFTGMRKREQGYNPDLGDWEFFTLDRSGSKVTARGKIDSCMDCHTKYKATDFVARRYLTTK